MQGYEYIFDSFRSGYLHPLYEEMFPLLMRYASRMAGSDLAYLAKDCVQDAIYRSYKERETFDSAVHWRNFLYMCIRNNVIDLIRKADYSQAYADNVLLSDNEQEDVSMAVIYNDALAAIFSVVDSLPDKYREIFHLSFREGLRNAEIAELLSIAEITVKKRKARLIEMIRKGLRSDIDNYHAVLVIELGALEQQVSSFMS
ncbi:MAG: sigma-70 family RNA polymerase sigma factor [Muribaculaceae bacterium]|nr:sigma-70 family RNA polymerase sigma factor [Muribaculaceae bacterium]